MNDCAAPWGALMSEIRTGDIIQSLRPITIADRNNARDYDRVQRFVRKDRAAETTLVHALTRTLRNCVAGTLRSSEPGRTQEAEDLVQEVWLHLLARDRLVLAQWNPARGLTLRSYVSLVARRRVISRLRLHHARRFRACDPDACDATPGTMPASRVEQRTLSRQWLAKIEAHLRVHTSSRGMDMFRRLFLLEQSTAEIAEATDLSHDAVYQWRRRLRMLLADLKDTR